MSTPRCVCRRCLDALRIEVLTEQERRVIAATSADQIAALQDAYERATMQEVAR